ncbi:MAG: radical SAM protein [bacterium]|nr:radical SAM protein [bacterium]
MPQHQALLDPVLPPTTRRIVVILIKPTSYDDEGFPLRFLRGVLPSNGLAAMYALTKQALAQVVPAGVATEVHMLEDGLYRHAKTLAQLYRRFPEPGTKLIAGLATVQTAQFPRACDLMDRWQAVGATCVIGGFHVSGSISVMTDGVHDPRRPGIPCPQRMPAEIQALMDRGVIVFHGEAEERWPTVLRDILRGTPQPLYRGGLPDLRHAPLPEYAPGYFRGNFATAIGTLDASRGCPFLCSFCTIINVQGSRTRCRSVSSIIEDIRAACERGGKAGFFLVDDNFARNPEWEEISDGLGRLRQQGHHISFMVQADVACGKVKGFIPKLAAAGCSQIFMGVESLNPKNLAAANKRQNNVDQYGQLWQLCHQHGIVVHAAYIIGFPHDTPESVAREVEQLAQLGADQASFYMLMPLPGSEDYARAVAAGASLDPDLNRYDSFHPVNKHPLMTHTEWYATYLRAWRQFYRAANIVAALKRFPDRQTRLQMLRNYAWYRWSFATERAHPMISGFYRFRDLQDRRPGTAVLSISRYLLQEGWRHLRYVGRFFAEFYRFQHIVLETEFAPLLAEKRDEMTGRLRGVRDWVRRTFGRIMTRQWLNNFWVSYARNRWRLLLDPRTYHWHLRMPPYALAEVVYTLRFAWLLKRLVKLTTT